MHLVRSPLRNLKVIFVPINLYTNLLMVYRTFWLVKHDAHLELLKTSSLLSLIDFSGILVSLDITVFSMDNFACPRCGRFSCLELFTTHLETQ